MGRLDDFAPHDSVAALHYLERRPYDNVYVAWLIRAGLAGRNGDLALWRDDAGTIAGVCYFGMQIVPSADDGAESEPALDAFAQRARTARTTTSMIVGRRLTVENFWERMRSWMPAPRAVRASQPVYALVREDLRYSRADADAARATHAELDELIRENARMIVGENGVDPLRSTAATAAFSARTARILDAGWWWRYRVDERLAFMCNVGSETPRAAQLQGVWTPPEMRGHGYATRAFGAICDRLLDTYPALCLYVNAFNAPAIALYERVGFRPVGEFATLLFG